MTNRMITIGNGKGVKKDYYYWDTYSTWKEALENAKKMKFTKRDEGHRIKYFILEATEGTLFPIKRFVLYFDKKMRLI